MDMTRIQAALEGRLDLCELTVPERLAFAHEAAPEVRRPVVRKAPLRFVVPEYIERLYRGTSS